MSETIPALVVGTGFGVRIHIPALRAAGFEVVGLVGNDPERTARRAEANGVKPFTNLDEAITRTGAKVVTIATTPSTHGKLALQAIAHGCHVICEKPFAFDAAEARAVLVAAERAGVVHLVGHEFRFLPERALVGRAIAEGLIGEPRFFSLTRFDGLVADPEAKMPRWWFDETSGGGWLGASGSHIIDQVRSTIGEIENVSAVLPITSDRKNVAEDSYLLRLTLSNGAEGVVQQTAGAWGPSMGLTRVSGTHGSVWIDNGAVKIADKSGVHDFPITPDLELPAPPAPSDDPRKRFSAFELGPYTRLCEALRAKMQNRDAQTAVPLPTFADGLACMHVMDAVRKSASKGGATISVGG